VTAARTAPATQRARWEALARTLSDEDLLLKDIRNGELGARVVSIPAQLIADADGRVPHDTIMAMNDDLAALVARYPGRIHGQASVDANGAPLHAGDLAKQLAQAFDNLETVLAQAGMTLANVVRLNFYTTDLPAFFKATPHVIGRLGGQKPPGTLLGVAALFHPDIMIEIEATAVG